jgi:hypothetical protein
MFSRTPEMSAAHCCVQKSMMSMRCMKRCWEKGYRSRKRLSHSRLRMSEPNTTIRSAIANSAAGKIDHGTCLDKKVRAKNGVGSESIIRFHQTPKTIPHSDIDYLP